MKDMKQLLLGDYWTIVQKFLDNDMIINADECKYICIGKSGNDNNIISLNEFMY